MARASHWVRRTHLFRTDEYICSACGHASDRPYKACPHCSAVMKRTGYDPSWVDEAEELSALLDEDW